jgi:hypothetical protein
LTNLGDYLQKPMPGICFEKGKLRKHYWADFGGGLCDLVTAERYWAGFGGGLCGLMTAERYWADFGGGLTVAWASQCRAGPGPRGLAIACCTV